MIEKLTDIEHLRAVVGLFNKCNEGFNERFTPEELIKLYDAFEASEWLILPHRWTQRQIEEAIQGRAPTWDANEEPTYDE